MPGDERATINNLRTGCTPSQGAFKGRLFKLSNLAEPDINGAMRFLALNGGPQYKFTPAISLFVSCRDQAEVDRYWDAFLAAGGTPTACGWLDDQFGLSWQIIPKALTELMSDPDPKKAGAVMQAMMKMKKIDVAALYAAHASA